MKKIIESSLGILLIMIIPAFITYITFVQMLNIPRLSINWHNHIPFIASISVYFITVGILYIRKWIKGLATIKDIEAFKGTYTHEMSGINSDIKYIKKRIDELVLENEKHHPPYSQPAKSEPDVN